MLQSMDTLTQVSASHIENARGPLPIRVITVSPH